MRRLLGSIFSSFREEITKKERKAFEAILPLASLLLLFVLSYGFLESIINFCIDHFTIGSIIKALDFFIAGIFVFILFMFLVIYERQIQKYPKFLRMFIFFSSIFISFLLFKIANSFLKFSSFNFNNNIFTDTFIYSVVWSFFVFVALRFNQTSK